MATPTADLTFARFIAAMTRHLPAELAEDDRVTQAAFHAYAETHEPEPVSGNLLAGPDDQPPLVPLVNRTLLDQLTPYEPEPVNEPQQPTPKRYPLTASGRPIKRKGRAAYKVLELMQHPGKWRVLDRSSPTAARATSYRYYDGVDALAEPNGDGTYTIRARYTPPTH